MEISIENGLFPVRMGNSEAIENVAVSLVRKTKKQISRCVFGLDVAFYVEKVSQRDIF